MQYMIMAIETPEAFADRDDAERGDAYWGAWTGYLAELSANGVLTEAAGLQPPSAATTLRMREGRRLLQDGPFADTQEQLGGYFVIDVADLDSALDWAERCPSARDGSVEVRPLLRLLDR
ncbi:MAG: hypothetical protein H0T85_10665 [Geodermatophilaceae bacterium]|nr:hypothetical protein [Geodermatophilaceae bacterium]